MSTPVWSRFARPYVCVRIGTSNGRSSHSGCEVVVHGGAWPQFLYGTPQLHMVSNYDQPNLNILLVTDGARRVRCLRPSEASRKGHT